MDKKPQVYIGSYVICNLLLWVALSVDFDSELLVRADRVLCAIMFISSIVAYVHICKLKNNDDYIATIFMVWLIILIINYIFESELLKDLTGNIFLNTSLAFTIPVSMAMGENEKY